MAATTAVQGSRRAWTVTLTIPRPPRIRWRWLTVAALIAGALFVLALTVAGARQTYAPTHTEVVEPVPCSTGGVGALPSRAAADPAPACPTQP